MTDLTSTSSTRRRQGILLALIASAVLWWIIRVTSVSLNDAQWLSGWILTGLMALLVLYNTRKKISFLPMGSNRVWLQIHIYTGVVTLALFLIHIKWRFPNGLLEVVLSLVFIAICLTGIVGIIMSRRFSRRLTHLGEQVLFERIPAFSARIKQEAEDLVRESVDETESTTLADFYSKNLSKFFNRPNATFGHLMDSNRHYFRLRNELIAHERYLNGPEKEFAERMQGLLEQKNNLDYQYALQRALKGWLFIHIPLSYSLVLIILAHIVLVYGFGAV